ncbi:recombinase family protein [Paenibacillus melissococcoides]|uniref:Recombinase family protein n=1 Tax=Paenibacillus melissococcoides TaxID=2912268 RepID=A0ABN8U8G9_9BACL|nr:MULTISPECIES: recombinase family protein [Paenibacillus]GIO82268.1 integrase [Paenibacillus dendritiformis]CAH8246293.1 recombinase family protein [Paenibacillus melissococcoides]CAH8713533.1 recombinase family protein [Paenibacillus melissococcoides]CAH8714268.1 recombinase family protein [Paenibacillus melissococcoides]
MVVGIYIRVSTEEQAQHGFSIDAQKEKMIAYCKSQGWEEYKLYIDDGYTGTNMDRPALNRLVRHIENQKINLVVVYKLDRLSRRQRDVLYILEEIFERNNVGFKSATQPFETTTPFGKAMIGVLAVFAQLERDMIVERTTAGRRQRIRMGKWYGGREPLGYYWDKEKEQLIIVPDEALLIKSIFDKYKDGASRLSIAEWARSRCNSRVIDHAVIRDILVRRIYIGELNDGGTWIKGNHEPIIDLKTWEDVQREIHNREEGATPKGEYLLTGLLKCGVCGENVVHVKRITKRYGKVYEYHLYACRNQHVRKKERSNNCSLGYKSRKNVEKYVIDQLKTITLYPDEFKEAQQTLKVDDNSESALFSLEEKLKKITSSLDNLYEAIQEGEIKASSVSGRIRTLEEQRESIENSIEDILVSKPVNRSNDDLFNIIKNVGMAWDYLTEDEQKTAIRKVIKSVTLQKDKDPIIELNFL